jgi:radical SAM superfamily enzyme YgiQ (UPF0313 family)
VSSPQKSPCLSVLHVGEALKQAKARGKSDETYEVRYFDLRYDDMTPEDFKWADVVGVSSMTGYQLKGAIWALKEAKRYGKRTILGGIHVSMQPEQCLAEDYVDSVVLSEGEWGVIQAIHGGHKERVRSRLAGTQDHVSPVSPETLIHFRRSARTGDTVLMTSRGCPFRCGFSISPLTALRGPRGYVMAKDVKAGDELVGYDEKSGDLLLTKIVATDPVVSPFMIVALKNGLILSCSPEHPIMTRRGWVLAGELLGNDLVMFRSSSGKDFSDIHTLGFNPTQIPQINIQCDPVPAFLANDIVTHNCYIQQFFERNWQSVDLDRWKYDVLYLKENAGVRKYEHGDDFIGRANRAFPIIRFLYENGIEYRPSMRAHHIDDEVARQLKALGVKHISVGMETASLRMLKLSEKDILPEHQLVCAESLAKHGIHPLFYWILKMPTETPAETNESLDQMDRIAAIFKKYGTPLTQNAYCFVPLPGSPLFDLVDKNTLPKSMREWSDFSLNQTKDEFANAAYWVAGLHFHKARGDKTDRNFPGLSRLLIMPFEWMASLRWKLRWFTCYRFEKWAIEWLLKWASLRYENKIRRGKFKLNEMQPMDMGVVENQPGPGARGEFMTGELGM